MLRPESIALELLEYKVADMRADRQVPGGVASVWELYHYVSKLAAHLTDAERDRLHKLSQRLQAPGEGGALGPARPRLDLASLVIEDPRAPAETTETAPAAPTQTLTPEMQAEQVVLQRLARRVWWSELEDAIQEIAARCRAEKDRATARLLYALVRNMELHLKNTQGAQDVNLYQFAVREPVPERLDPLVSLNSLDNLTDLVREVLELIMALADGHGPYGRVPLPPGQAISYLKKMALAIARDPYAGQLAAAQHKGPTSAQLRLALQELAKEPIREDEKQLQMRAIEHRLKHRLMLDRQQRETHQQDIAAFVHAAETFFDRLERFMPQRVGGEAGEPQLKGGVLFAENRALRVTAVPPDAKSLTLRLKGPTRFALCGLEMAVTGNGRAQALAIHEQSYPLQPKLKIDLERHSVLALLEGAYLYLRVTDTSRPLAALLAEALLVYTVLGSGRLHDLLEVLRVAGTVSGGEARDIILQALERLKVVSARAPSRRVAIEGMLRGAAKARSVVLPDNLVLALVQRFHAAMTVEAGDLPQVLDSASGALVNVYALGDDPLSLTIGGQPVTIRKYRRRRDAADSVVVMLPGRVLGSFKATMVRQFPGGVLICARSDTELATLYFEGAQIEDDTLQTQP